MTNKFDKSAITELKKSINSAESNQQPFLAKGDNGNPVVVGDVNQTDQESDYIAQFLVSKGDYNLQEGEDYEEQGDNLLVSRKLSKVSITPRKARRMRHAVSVLLSSFIVFNKEGKPELQTTSGIVNVYERLDDSIVDAMEKIVSTTLDISESDMEYLTDDSLVRLSGQIIENNSGFFQ